ncbi:hypothetical protein AMR42_10720 [Limnothrix sp. PR1529]|uniref:abortive infection family protein n=1 Tax=Limnothrix sp. PR1529 TaxID=1704291 RepID=UPI00081F1A2A|nr:abortive infection family protein [Limnothrix sp. PR1529]OCQ93151.1 hypothetical protein BCR12_12565 [Limnothrix sp. P13C2]PIB10097.1 hypothetical protein AMR42_10720 [Limnothrix sp. PR1529]
MTADWYPGIRAFCQHWNHAQTLQNTFATLEQTFAEEQDACIDAAKAMVECACRVIIETLDDPQNPKKPTESDPKLGKLLGIATQMLKLGEIRHRAFSDLIREYNRLAEALRVLRNEAGTISHGRDGFITKLSIHHRRTAILAADAIVTFLHEAYIEQGLDPLHTLEPYDRFELSNTIIDKYTVLKVDEYQDDGFLSITAKLPNDDEISLVIEPSRLLFGVDRQAYKAALDACRDAELMDIKSPETNLEEAD